MTFKYTRYAIRRGPASGTGAIRVGADQVEFFGSDLCEGTGVYVWNLENGILTFEEVGDDACSGRSEVLIGQAYRRE